jgi:malate dehydrogenase (oxaloacetate-decarboxylating)
MPSRAYKFNYDEYGKTREIILNNRGLGIHVNNYTNKGTAFSKEERKTLGLNGMLPPMTKSLKEQVENSAYIVSHKNNDIEKFIYIRSLFDRNATLAHALIASDINQYMKIIYTPTVGLACQNFSSMFRQANGLHFYPGNINMAEDILYKYGHRDIRVAVVTDNQGILGIGDQGAGGIAICLGKLMLYTQGAGIAPWHCLPVSLDVGTDNKTLLESKYYLGWQHPRITGNEYVSFVQQFARAFKNVFPKAICQWEDFSKQNAFAIRDTYLHDLISFNDDIQGTGAVTLAAILTAMKIKKEKLEKQKFLIHGAGAGGVGIAEQIDLALRGAGLSQEESRKIIFTVDSKGLVTTDRKLEPYKEKFAKDPIALKWLTSGENNSMASVIKHEKITVLIGTSGQTSSFNPDIVQLMLANSERPVILPLSNPTSKAEAEPGNLYKWSQGRVLFATGSPFPPLNTDKRPRVGQCNNVFVFPGIGLGVIASGATEILPAFFTAAARAVSEEVNDSDLKKSIIMPSVENLRKISLKVAQAVGYSAIENNCTSECSFSEYQHHNDHQRLSTLIKNMRWEPKYLPLQGA